MDEGFEYSVFSTPIISLPQEPAVSGWIWQNPLTIGNPLYSVAALDADTAIAVGDVGTILLTTDGCINWKTQSSGTDFPLFSVAFPDANTGIALGVGIILRTTDRGASWSPASVLAQLEYLLNGVHDPQCFTNSLSVAGRVRPTEALRC